MAQFLISSLLFSFSVHPGAVGREVQQRDLCFLLRSIDLYSCRPPLHLQVPCLHTLNFLHPIKMHTLQFQLRFGWGFRRGEALVSVSGGHELRPYWNMLLPFSYAIVSGAVGSCSVLFAKSLSNMLRLAMSTNYQLHTWFTYSMLLLFLSTAGFWVSLIFSLLL